MTKYWCMREPDRDIIRLGHIHDYFRINFDVLWDVVHKDIPLLKSQILRYVEEM